MSPERNISRKLLNSLKGDRALWFIFLMFAIVSLVSVFSTIGTISSRPWFSFMRHGGMIIGSFVVAVAIANMDYRKFSSISWFGYLLAIGLLILSFIIGHKGSADAGSGTGRWIPMPIIGQFQPSELAKVVIVVYLARLLAKERDSLHEWPTIRNILIAVLIIVIPIVFDNLSTAVIILAICFAVIAISPTEPKYWRRVLLGIVILGLLVVFLGEKTNIPLLKRSETWTNRIDNWLHFDEEELSQETMARMAIASGKMLGVGIGSTVFGRLMTQANNDMIYSIIIEETGIAGGILVLVLFIYFYIRCVKIAWSCKGMFGQLTVVGLGTLIFVQAAINMAVSVGGLPVTGQNLPFISSGGSSYLFSSVALGIIQSVANGTKVAELNRERKKAAVAPSGSRATNPDDSQQLND